MHVWRLTYCAHAACITPCRYEGQWKAGKRHGQGLMLFADGTVFTGAWEEDEWLQSAAEPALCRMSGPGLKGAVAGQRAEFTIQVICPSSQAADCRHVHVHARVHVLCRSFSLAGSADRPCFHCQHTV